MLRFVINPLSVFIDALSFISVGCSILQHAGFLIIRLLIVLFKSSFPLFVCSTFQLLEEVDTNLPSVVRDISFYHYRNSAKIYFMDFEDVINA